MSDHYAFRFLEHTALPGNSTLTSFPWSVVQSNAQDVDGAPRPNLCSAQAGRCGGSGISRRRGARGWGSC